MPDYDAENDRLMARYNRAVGRALELGIKVYYPGGQAKTLGDLESEIRVAEGKPAKGFEDYLIEALMRYEQ